MESSRHGVEYSIAAANIDTAYVLPNLVETQVKCVKKEGLIGWVVASRSGVVRP